MRTYPHLGVWAVIHVCEDHCDRKNYMFSNTQQYSSAVFASSKENIVDHQLRYPIKAIYLYYTVISLVSSSVCLEQGVCPPARSGITKYHTDRLRHLSMRNGAGR